MSDGGAVIQGDYRYVLWRKLSGADLRHRLLWIMLNPSTATAEADDHTIRKVCGFTRRWGFAEPRVVNLYALRTRHPEILWTYKDPVGPENDHYIVDELRAAQAVVLAWGAHAKQERERHVFGLLRQAASVPVWHLGLTSSGRPKHPLTLGYATERQLFPFEIYV